MNLAASPDFAGGIYWTADLEIELIERLSLLTSFHYEYNIWTSTIAGDERNGAHENVFQGQAILLRHLNEKVRIFGGVQRSSRKESFELNVINKANVDIGVQADF